MSSHNVALPYKDLDQGAAEVPTCPVRDDCAGGEVTERDYLLPGDSSAWADSPGAMPEPDCPAMCPATQRAQPTRDVAGEFEEAACRICQDGDLHERLVSPCLCSGTVGFIHVSCLNTWLQVTSRTSCELCGFPFPVTKKLAPVKEYLRHPRANMDLPNLICDLACLVVLTPLLFASVYLSSTGTLRYESLGQAGSVCAVVTLLISLILVYVSWAALAIVYHIRVWQAWRERHSTVTTLNERQLVNFRRTPPVKAKPSAKKSRPGGGKLTSERKVKDGPALREEGGGQYSSHRKRDTDLLLAPISRLSGWIRVNNRVAARSPHHV